MGTGFPQGVVVALCAGARLGPYEVLGPIGAGGMGEVYRARDCRLGRDVAIKILPAERLSDPRRRARLVLEARAASALNHPNIVTIHEIESAEGIDFIVMELVAGETLARVLRRGPLSADAALRVAIPVAEALAAAHAAGIVHRDLKPGNVMLRTDGTVKVLDFGLAKAVRADTAVSDEETATAMPEAVPLSQPGMVVGTAGYLSPEQAKGGSVDARSDIFGFGAVLYEMVTGRRAFPGESSGEALAAVLREEPRPPGELVPGVPRDLERIILRCLRKDPARRFQHMDDVKVELQEQKEESDSQSSAPPAGATSARWTRRRSRLWATASILVLALATAVTLSRLWRPPLPPPTVVPLTTERKAFGGTFSPDGTQVAFGSAGEDGQSWDIWLKIVGQAEARRLTDDDAPEHYPAWSPDGTQIAFLRYPALPGSHMPTFWDPGFVHLVSPLGGAARRLSDFPARLHLSWSPDGRWLAAARARRGDGAAGGIHLLSVATGEVRAVTVPKPPAVDVSPAFAPDGRRLAYASCAGAEFSPVCGVAVLPLDSELRPLGLPRIVTHERILIEGLAWSRDGRSIVYGAGPGPYLWRVSADGGSPPERLELAGRGATGPAAAAGRDRLVYSRRIWDPDIYALRAGTAPRALVQSTFADGEPQYSPDGQRIAFTSDRAGDVLAIWLAKSDGSNASRLTRGPGRKQMNPAWSPDGTTIAFAAEAETGGVDVWTIAADGTALRQVTRGPTDEAVPRWSRDGRFLYFTSNRSGRNESWRISLVDGKEEPVSRGGGEDPRESFDGRFVYDIRPSDKALRVRPAAGGEGRVVVTCVDYGNYAPEPRSVLYVECTDPNEPIGRRVLRRWEPATGRDQAVDTVEATFIWGVAVSPDGRTILYGRASWGTADLVIIENFR